MYTTFIQCCSWTEPHRVPSLKEILQNLGDILQSEEFHDRCSKEYFQGKSLLSYDASLQITNEKRYPFSIDQFQEYRFNLVKSCELASTWWQWDDVFERFIGQILWPLVKDEKGKDIPLEIIGEICRPRLSEYEDKMGVAEIRKRISLSLDERCPGTFDVLPLIILKLKKKNSLIRSIVM